MSNGNGSNDGVEERTKKCPLLGEWCIGEACALHTELTQNMGGLHRKMGLCSFNATIMMLSEMNQKLQTPPPRIQLPPGIRG